MGCINGSCKILGKDRVVVAIDSVSHMLRHAPLSSVLRLLSNLRCHEKISSLFWLIHTDLREPKVVGSFEYISTTVASLEPIVQLPDYANENSGNITSLEENYSKAKFNVRLKRRNGRVKLFCEELLIEQDSRKFSSVPSISSVVTQNLLPKVRILHLKVFIVMHFAPAAAGYLNGDRLDNFTWMFTGQLLDRAQHIFLTSTRSSSLDKIFILGIIDDLEVLTYEHPWGNFFL